MRQVGGVTQGGHGPGPGAARGRGRRASSSNFFLFFSVGYEAWRRGRGVSFRQNRRHSSSRPLTTPVSHVIMISKMRDEPLFLGTIRCNSCHGKAIHRLVGGVCPRCWTEASARIRARFASQGDAQLRYSAHGRPHALHAKKHSVSRAETPSSTDPAVSGRETTDPTGAPCHSSTGGALPQPAAGVTGHVAAPTFP